MSAIEKAKILAQDALDAEDSSDYIKALFAISAIERVIDLYSR